MNFNSLGKYLTFLVLALLVLPAMSCKKRTDSGKDILVFGRSGDARNMDPAQATDGETFNSTSQIYDTLVQFKLGTTELISALAEKWDVSKDGLEYTFYLRKGVKFHQTEYFDGDEFTAKDVLFSFNRQANKNHPFHKRGDGKKAVFKYWQALKMNKVIKKIQKVDTYTVKFILHEPNATFLDSLTMDFLSILSKKYADQLLSTEKQEEISRKPIGTGPFVFQRWIKDDRIIYRAHKNYWDGAPKVQQLIFKAISENSVRAQELVAKQIHIMDFPNPEQIENLEKQSHIKTVRQEGLNVGYLAFQCEKEPMSDVNFRLAVYHCIDKEGIIKSIYAGFARPAKNPIPPILWGYNDDIEDYPFDLKKAKEYLEKSKYAAWMKKNNRPLKLYAMPVTRPYMPNAKKVAEVIQANLAKIGVKVKIVSFAWTVYLDKVTKGEHDMALLGWTADIADPDNFLNILLHSKSKGSQNIAYYGNKELDKILDKAKTLTGQKKKRTELYKKAQEIFHREVPWVPLVHTIIVAPTNKRVKGFKLDPTGKRRFHRVELTD